MPHLQRVARIANTTIVIGSALLTGVFGWTFGGGNYLLGTVFFAIFAMLSILVPVFSEYTGRQATLGNVRVAAITGLFALIFFAYDVVTNFGTGALFRQIEITQASNQNAKATDIRNEVRRIEGRIETIRTRTAWTTDYLAPESYDSEVLRLKSETEGGRNIWQRSKECTNTTLESSQRVCQGIASAIANKQNALERKALKDEMRELERELVEAKARSVDAPSVASAALTHARNAGAFATGAMDPSDKAVFWANYGLTFSAALMCSLAGFATSLLLGWMSIENPPPRYEPEPKRRYLEASQEARGEGDAIAGDTTYLREAGPVRVRMSDGKEANVAPMVARAMEDAGLATIVPMTITAPIEINLPVNVNHSAGAEGAPPATVHHRNIGLVRDTAFARRVAQITGHLKVAS